MSNTGKTTTMTVCPSCLKYLNIYLSSISVLERCRSDDESKFCNSCIEVNLSLSNACDLLLVHI